VLAAGEGKRQQTRRKQTFLLQNTFCAQATATVVPKRDRGCSSKFLRDHQPFRPENNWNWCLVQAHCCHISFDSCWTVLLELLGFTIGVEHDRCTHYVIKNYSVYPSSLFNPPIYPPIMIPPFISPSTCFPYPTTHATSYIPTHLSIHLISRPSINPSTYPFFHLPIFVCLHLTATQGDS
jgi:hypothetical protein